MQALMISLLVGSVLLGGCASDCPKCRAELSSLKEEVTRLREDVAAVNALVAQGRSEVREKRSTVVIGREKDTVRVRILRQGIICDGRRLAIEALSAHAAAIADRQPNARVGVIVDEGVGQDRVLQVLDLLKRAGLAEVYLHSKRR